ncbi:hypothetical protein ACFE04_011277 [Oxalis oulophora]
MGSILQAIIRRSSVSEDRSTMNYTDRAESLLVRSASSVHHLLSSCFEFLWLSVPFTEADIIIFSFSVTGGSLDESREALAIAETDGSLDIYCARQTGSSPVMSLRLLMDQSLQIL